MQDSTERVGRYQLLEPIGGGPNGSVSRAKVFGVAGFERQFAIKRFLPELTASPSAAQALSAAARSYGSLEHPRIARMSEFGVAQGQTFTAVELVAGLDVMRLVAESRIGGTGLAAGGALALISQAARAVGYAHGRGLSHLGLAPTNVIVTAEGDVKVTDFGVLAATIPARPVDAARLAQRIGYLAPEQLAGEATSAATDVFVLGVIAYELVTGQRAFFGDSPHAIANAILAGPPADPPLPRTIGRVLSRCLARSQFERFPDARAFADALDAALRVAPVPGTRKDIGAQVKATMDRHAAMNEGNLSGMVAMNLGARAPIPAPTRLAGILADLDLDIADAPEGVSTTEFVRPDVEVARPAPLVGPATMPGLAPPRSPPIPTPGITAQTVFGMPTLNKKPQIPPIRPIPSIAKPGAKPGTVPPALRQTQPGVQPSRRAPSEPDTISTSGTDRPANLRPGLGLRPGSDLAVPYAGTRPVSEADIMTLPGDDDKLASLINSELSRPLSDFGTLGDVATRPGVYDRAESDFSDLATEDPDAGSTLRSDDDFATPLAGTSIPRTTDDPPTAPVDVLPEVHSRGGLMPFVPPSRDFGKPEATNSGPAIEILREPGESLDIKIEPKDALRAAKGTTEPARAVDVDPLIELQLEAHAPRTTPMPASPMSGATLFGIAPAAARPPPRSPSQPPPVADRSAPGTQPPPLPPGGLAIPTMLSPGAPLSRPPMFSLPSQQGKSTTKRRWPLVLGIFVVLGVGAGVGAWQLLLNRDSGDATEAVVAESGSGSARGSAAHVSGSNTTGSGGSNVAAGSNTGSAGSNVVVAVGSNTGSAGSNVVVALGSNAGSAGSAVASVGSGSAAGSAGSGAGSAIPSTKPTVAPTANSDSLQIASAPAGARVFIDGADQGVTPVKLAGSTDRHTMSLLLAGHELYVAEVDGHGAFEVPLKPVTPSGGPAGIKVIKCKDKDRYYVFVDGKPTGMTCPTERIETSTGAHTVEVYDVVTENRRKWDINVADTRLSYRVRVD